MVEVKALIAPELIEIETGAVVFRVDGSDLLVLGSDTPIDVDAEGIRALALGAVAQVEDNLARERSAAGGAARSGSP